MGRTVHSQGHPLDPEVILQGMQVTDMRGGPDIFQPSAWEPGVAPIEPDDGPLMGQNFVLLDAILMICFYRVESHRTSREALRTSGAHGQVDFIATSGRAPIRQKQSKSRKELRRLAGRIFVR